MTFTDLSPADLHRTFITASQHGGGFIAALSNAWIHGDSSNRRRIEAAFPEIVTRYGPESSFFYKQNS
jgi:hypothetical protein